MSLRGPFGIIGSVKTFQTLLWAAAAAAAFADGQPFDRYQTIIDRKPFGPEPVNFDPEAAPGSAAAAGGAAAEEMTAEQRTVEEQQLAASVRVSILNVRPSGSVAVGFTDSSVNPAENYYLTVGSSQNGWTVKSANPAAESVTLEKDGIEVTVKLGETAGGGNGGRAAAQRRLPQRGILAGRQNASEAAAPAAPRALGGLARLRQQRMEMAAREQEDAARKREADAAAKAEREAREAREAEEKQRAAEERAQQREALLQIQEQLKKAREEREAARREQEGQQSEANDVE